MKSTEFAIHLKKYCSPLLTNILFIRITLCGQADGVTINSTNKEVSRETIQVSCTVSNFKVE